MMLTGFILAAGFGTRLRPLTDHIPKALAPICGKPLLQRALEQFCRFGITRIGVNAFHFPDQMKAFKEQSTIAFDLFTETEKIRGTGGALHFARDFLSATDDFFICNVDILAHVNIEALYKKFLSYNCSAGLVAIASDSEASIRYDNTTKEYTGAKSDSDASGRHGEFLGMVFYKRDFLSTLHSDDFSILPVWKRAQNMGQSIKVIETEAIYWKDAGTPKALAGIHFDLIEGKCALSLPSHMIIDSPMQKAYPAHYCAKEISRLGPNVWCEASSIPDGITFENSIVLNHAVLTPGKSYKNIIITEWGEIPF
jgi:N-acetyl-alpha-D-muramate 1-phosphate uridylyltransferase